MERDNTPVIIGVAQRSWRERDIARTPLDALEEVALAALGDCGAAAVRPALDAIAHVPFLLTQVPELAAMMPRNIGAALAQRLGLSVQQYGAVTGGNLPQTMINALAAAVVAGEHRVVLVCGTELLNTFLGTLRRGEAPPDWSTGREDHPQLLGVGPETLTAPSELDHGVFEPIVAYPLIESALRHARGWDRQTHLQVLGALVSGMSRVAAANPLAWKRDPVTAQATLSTDGGNRVISSPYTKVMNAIASVDMAAAAVLTTAANARRLGVPREQWVYLWGGADTHDTCFVSERPELHRSAALAAATDAVFRQTGLGIDDIGLFDLYSCFPSAVQVACEALGLALDDPRGLTVTGGMTLFGGPGNNYSLHAIAEMVARLRVDRTGVGLVTANGGYLTKHSVGIYGGQPPQRAWQPTDNPALQAQLDARPHPRLVERYDGPMTVEACTVRYAGAEPQTGIVLGRLGNGQRCLAHTGDDPSLLARLAEEDCIDLRGVVQAGQPVNRFRL